MKSLSKVIVFAENTALLPELCGGGRQLAEQVQAIVIGPKEAAQEVTAYADKTFWLGEKATGTMLEDYTDAIAGIIREEAPALVLIRTSKRARVIAGRLSVLLKAGVVSDALEFQVENDTTLSVKHMVFGGGAVRLERSKSAVTIALVGAGVFATPESGSSGELVQVAVTMPEPKIICKETRPREGEKVDLGLAKRVIGIGRGFAKREDLSLAEKLAAALNAELACSRPIAEGENWMARSRYIGVSGAMIKPELYFAVGISGQVQHMVGVNKAKTIITVNNDKNAPIFNYADYGIVGDLYKVIPTLLELVQK